MALSRVEARVARMRRETEVAMCFSPSRSNRPLCSPVASRARLNFGPQQRSSMTSFSPDLMCLTLCVGFCCSMALSKLTALVATLTNCSLTNCSCRQPGSSTCTSLLTVSTPSTHLSSTTMVSNANRVSSRVDEEVEAASPPPGAHLPALTRSQRVSVGHEKVAKPLPSVHCEQSNTEIVSRSKSSQLRSAPSCSTSKSLRPVVSTSSDHSASSSLISSTSSLTTELLTTPVSSSITALFASTTGSLSTSAAAGSTSASGRSGMSPSEMSLTLSRTLSSLGGVVDFLAGCRTGLRQPLLLLRA